MAERRQQRDRKPRDFKGRDQKSRNFKPQQKQQEVETQQPQQEEVVGEMIAGKNPVLEALRSGREINKLFIAEGVKKTGVQELMDLAKERGVLVQFVPKQKIDKLAENHQGIVAAVAAYDYAELEDLFEAAKAKNEDPFFLILDELEDPHNLGSIIRTADAAVNERSSKEQEYHPVY